MDKLIITAAITGSIHTPSMSPFLPLTPEQIADESVRAAEAGAAIVHLHVRDPLTGQPSSDMNLFGEVLRSIKKRSDVVVNITTGGAVTMTPDERVRAVPSFKPEMASLNMGSMNFGLYPMTKRKSTHWEFDWETKYLEGTRDAVFKNTFADTAFFCKTMYENGTKPELECYDVGHIYNVKQHIEDGSIKPPIHIQFVLGVLGGIGATPEDLLHMKATADRLIGQSNYTYSVCAAGRMEFALCMLSSILGGHLRVGLEDNLYLSRGVLAKSNAELVTKAKQLASDITGREPATPEDARQILGLKGKAKTSF
jgi:uncharacterized protein (DUF849 family)